MPASTRAPGGGLAIAVGTDSIGPEIFLIGTNQEIYYQQLNANGTPMAGASFQQTAAVPPSLLP